ncbi:hypothetical protein RJG79_07950 [Mycoplasmatota bacterium WC44]
MNIIDTIFFYTRNDYLIINSLLCNKIIQLWEVCELVNNDSIGVLKEHKDGIRTLDTDSIKRYESRIYECLDDKAKDKIIKTAQSDIINILNVMVPTKQEILLYRTIWQARIGDTFNENKINDIIEFKNISSTSTIPYMEDAGRDFYRYEIIIPKNSKILELNQFDPFIRNEDNEVLTPPMKCRIINIYNNDNPKCKGIIKVECIEQIYPNI